MAASGAVIRRMGAVSPVGLGVEQTAASVRAGVARFEESPVFGKRLQPLTLSVVPEKYMEPLDPALTETSGLTSRQLRMIRLAGAALRESADGEVALGRVPLFLGTPESIGDQTIPAGDRFLQQLTQQSGVDFDLSSSRMFNDGRAAGLIALKEGLSYLERGDGDRVLVGGVDSYYDLSLLANLDLENRIAGHAIPDGFIPGEGAAFMILERSTPAAATGEVAPVSIRAVGVAQEPGHRYSEDEPHTGDGLPTSVEQLTKMLGDDPEPVKTVFAGFNGESFWGKEWGLACIRHASLYAEQVRVESPVDCFGDLGAALGPMMIVLAVVGAREGYLSGPYLVWCSSDREPRACAFLQQT